MKAVAITPRQPNTCHLVELPDPRLEEVPGGRGVLVKVLEVGVDGTDKELYQGEYGAAPEGYDFLIIGHESLGKVAAVGPNVTELAPGDYVVATVRRPGGSIYDQIGTYDMTTDDNYRERGINLLHGFLTEYYVDAPEYLVKVPAGLKLVGVLLEPMSVVEKGIGQAYEIQRRLKVWQPRRAAVMGAGTIGLLAALGLRLRGLEVTSFARGPKPNLNASLVESIGVRYVSTREVSVAEATAAFGPFDLIFEATGYSPLVFGAAHAMAKNGILVLSSVTGGDRKTEVESDRLNLEFVLGNKVMFGTVNGHRGYFEAGIADFAVAEATWPGWLSSLLTHSIRGLENHAELFRTLLEAEGAIKVRMVVGDEATRPIQVLHEASVSQG
ncbi:MAG: glucose 1-dehydrogenase [Chloroflexi bacterium]|nr:glucose 1-dehydrogenase [Chloroflexota bacterium]